jgi:hypothetical protein
LCPPFIFILFLFSRRRNFQTTKALVAASTANLSFLIPARYSSLKQLLVTHRASTGATTGNFRATTLLSSFQLASYQFRVGSVLMPQAKVTSAANGSSAAWGGEILMELMRSFHALGGASQESAIGLGSWTQQPETYKHGSFCVGLELESFANKSDVIMSGVSTLGQNVFFEATYDVTSAPAALVDAFACYDVLYTLQDGVLTAQF